MNAEYLLKEVKQSKEIKITQKMLSGIPEFKTGNIVSSLESLALTLNGHQPITKYSFDINKLEIWCKKNSLRFYLEEQEQLLHLKCDARIKP